MSKPDDYSDSQGARFRVEFPKHRSFYGAAAQPFIVQLTEAGWEIESDAVAGTGTKRKICDYLRVADEGNVRPRSANAAIKGACVGRNDGLEVWAEMLKAGEIVKHSDGGFRLVRA